MNIVYTQIKNSDDFINWFPQFRIGLFYDALLGYNKIQFPKYYSIFFFDESKFPGIFNDLNLQL